MPGGDWIPFAGGFVVGALAATGAIWWRWRHRLHRTAVQVEDWLKRKRVER